MIFRLVYKINSNIKTDNIMPLVFSFGRKCIAKTKNNRVLRVRARDHVIIAPLQTRRADGMTQNDSIYFVVKFVARFSPFFYRVPSLQDLFKTVKPEVILEFLKAAALYRLL